MSIATAPLRDRIAAAIKTSINRGAPAATGRFFELPEDTQDVWRERADVFLQAADELAFTIVDQSTEF